MYSSTYSTFAQLVHCFSCEHKKPEKQRKGLSRVSDHPGGSKNLLLLAPCVWFDIRILLFYILTTPFPFFVDAFEWQLVSFERYCEPIFKTKHVSSKEGHTLLRIVWCLKEKNKNTLFKKSSSLSWEEIIHLIRFSYPLLLWLLLLFVT